MFRSRQPVKYIFEWTVPAQPWAERRSEFIELAGRAVRAVGIGVTIFSVNFALSKWILPDLQAPTAANLQLFIGSVIVLGALGALIGRFGDEQQKFAVSDKAIHTRSTQLSPGMTLPFEFCQAYFLHDSRNALELFTRDGRTYWLGLPREEPLKAQVVEFVQARVKPWVHLEAPSQLRVRAGTLKGLPLWLFWILTLLGSIVLGSSLEVYKWVMNNSGVYLFLGMWLFGFGWIWFWNAWTTLQHFPWKIRLEFSFSIAILPNVFFSSLLMQFLAVFAISRIAP